jgi:hypothetical protein
LEALWRAVFGGPPSVDASPEVMSAILVRCLPPAPPYGQPDPAPVEDDQ